ncbi:spore protease YyaC [Virgibacillus sp. MG-45]|uniref:spore protease YyaC n=1 Tax=Virgibacillus sp. MG-45 TaxID=3102791 RepID=UPI002ED83366
MNLKSRFQSKIDSVRIDHTAPHLDVAIGDKLISWFPSVPREYVVVCIGTDRSTGDALGPLVGSFLTEMKPRHLSIFGTLEHPVHATNLHEYIKEINHVHKNPFIIAVDACLGKTHSVGKIIATEGPLQPGAALNKPLPAVGDVHLTGVVNVSGFMEYSVLQNTRLAIVVEMAKKIAGLLESIDYRLIHHRKAPAVVVPQIKSSTL